MQMHPKTYRIFCDIEVDNPKAKEPNILEVAVVIVDKKFEQYGEYSSPIHLDADRYNKNPVLDQSELVGLCKESKTTLADAEARINSLLDRVCFPGASAPVFVLAGLSPRSLDVPFIRKYLPKFASRLDPYHTFDVSTLISAVEGSGMDVGLTKDFRPQHRALKDVQDAIRAAQLIHNTLQLLSSYLKVINAKLAAAFEDQDDSNSSDST